MCKYTDTRGTTKRRKRFKGNRDKESVGWKGIISVIDKHGNKVDMGGSLYINTALSISIMTTPPEPEQRDLCQPWGP